MSPKERAERSAKAMWESDMASQWFGMELLKIDEGFAEMKLAVQKHHGNGHGICHGAVIFALADSAFAFACNSRNQATVAQHNSISYIAPAKVNDTLTAIATEVNLVGRNGTTDVTVKNQNGETIALFRGASRAIKGNLFKEETIK